MFRNGGDGADLSQHWRKVFAGCIHDQTDYHNHTYEEEKYYNSVDKHVHRAINVCLGVGFSSIVQVVRYLKTLRLHFATSE